MRPSDPRVRRQLRPARRPLAGVVAGGAAGSVLVIVQAWVVTGLVVAALADPLDDARVSRWAVAAVAVLAARAATGWAVDVLAARAAAAVGTDLRRRLVRAVLGGAAGSRSSGELAVLATRGVSAAEPYLTRYLPALVLATFLPALTVVVIATQDLLSALIVACTLPLVPLFGALVGLATRDRAASQWRAMSSLSGHFVDVMRGLPTLVAFRRARAQSATIREVTDRYRRATLGTLRLAFASSAVLELVATLSVALVAVVVGVRLAAGDLDLGTGLLVLLLAPEAYWPLRRVGAEFHASAEGVATFEAVDALRRPGAVRRGRGRARRPRGVGPDGPPRRPDRPGAGRLHGRLPRPRRHRADRPVRVRQDDPAHGPRRARAAHRGPAHRRWRAGGWRGVASPGLLAAPATGVRGRQHRRQPAAGRSRGRRRPAVDGAAPGGARGAGPGVAPRARRAGRRGRRHPLRGGAGPPGAGPGGAGRAALGAPGRAHRPPRRADRADHRRHRRRARPDQRRRRGHPPPRPRGPRRPGPGDGPAPGPPDRRPGRVGRRVAPTGGRAARDRPRRRRPRPPRGAACSPAPWSARWPRPPGSR